MTPTSRVEEIVLPIDGSGEFIFGPGGVFGPAAPVWTYQDPAMNSAIMSSAERLPNGNTLICSGLQGRIFEITTGGTNVWEVASPTVFRASYVERTFWPSKRELSVSVPFDAVDFDLIASSRHAGDTYIVLGSVTGTSPGIPIGPGLNLPLNWDTYSNLTLNLANSSTFSNFLGILDGLGGGSASLVLPAVTPPEAIGLELHHAYLVADPTFTDFKAVSNAENVVFTP